MRTYGRRHLHWEGNDLFLLDKKLIGIFHGDVDSDLWWLRWPDGIISADFYNKTRAKEHAFRLSLKELNNGVEEEDLDMEETAPTTSVSALN